MRALAFKIKESISGRRVLKNVEDLRNSYGKKTDLQERRFANILQHAIKTTEFYSSYGGYFTLQSCPVIDKQTIKENYDQFLSRGFLKENLYKMTTSGSYGTPFTFYLSKEKKLKQQAEVIYFGEWSNYFVGTKHAYLMTKSKSKLKLFFQNEIIMAPYTLDLQWLEQQRNILRKQKPKVLIGYTSAIVTLANYIISKKDNFILDGVITVSEVLSEEHREIIKKAFRATPLSRYSTQEFGVLANECPQETKHHLNNVNYIIEILDIDKDIPAKPGELGRVVVTDLFSHAMPLIRYDTGDLAILGQGTCKCGLETPYLEVISGRLVEEVFDVNGNTVSGFAVNGAMQDIENVLQYQFVQEGENEYRMIIIKINNFDGENKIKARFQEFLGRNAKIIFEYTDEIPPLKSGKRPYIINKMKKSSSLSVNRQ
ncbi:phenylacetate--CoA ligase family protein [Sporosarcina koreensis]|uniref:Phenylacetate--CoA ligase family protein n=1 Tax=Sporosarcina koreensis TaxID=334735 RepID=A0ABW0U3N5_9BACL